MDCVIASSPKCDINFDISVCYGDRSPDSISSECRSDVPSCRKGFTITHLHVEPYNIKLVEELIKRLVVTEFLLK